MSWDPDSRFLQRRYHCEWCDTPVAPDEEICAECVRAELDRELEEQET